MAVAEKTSAETKTAGAFDRLSMASLAGVVYVLVSLAIVFTGIPTLWTSLGLSGTGFTGTTLVVLASLTALVVLAIAGYKLMGGAASRPGLRAGIFMGIVWLLMLLILCRWIAGIFEGWVYSASWFVGNERTYGIIIPGILCGLLVWWLGKKFFRPGFEGWLVRFEAAGWFHARSYKPGQGMRVRRGTILGILLVSCSGIYLLVNRETLHGDWDINIPFSGNLIVDDFGDGAAALKELRDDEPKRVPQSFNFRVLSVGAAKDVKVDETLDRDALLKVVKPIADAKLAELNKLLDPKKEKSLAARYEELRKINDPKYSTEASILHGWIGELEEFKRVLETAYLTSNKAEAGDSLFLLQQEIDAKLKVNQEKERERKRVDEDARSRGSLVPEMETIAAWARENQLPEAGMVIDRFLARDLNHRLDADETRILKYDPTSDQSAFRVLTKTEREDFHIEARGDLVSRANFDNAVSHLRAIAAAREPTRKTAAADEAEKEAYASAPEARPIDGRVAYASLLLLPGIAVTLPLLLLVLSVWLAWRIVNLPVFADFLIATEAEINKVSWTTRSRLVQDTIVVLVTMALMGLFLFVVDVAWAHVLSRPWIGVLKVSDKDAKPKTEESLRW